MYRIVGTVGYTVPFFGNSRSSPYGKLAIKTPSGEKLCTIKENDDGQYITVDRKRLPVLRMGSLYSPLFVFRDTMTGCTKKEV